MTRALLLALLLSAPPAWAVLCDQGDTIPPNAPDARYRFSVDPGTGRAVVEDRLTGLQWMRCSLGQRFDAERQRCIDAAALYTWQEALQAAQAYAADGWRLPNIQELQSLVNLQCYGPAIHTGAFPDTPSSWTPESSNVLDAPIGFWSATPHAFQDGKGEYSSAWILQPFLGDAAPAPKASRNFVRLVRPAPPAP